jgi:hypothetical protein
MGDSVPKRTRRKSPDQKGSWPTTPGEGPTVDSEDVTMASSEEFNRTKGRSPRRMR